MRHLECVTPPRKLIFLPGAGGNPSFWQPVADLLATRAERKLFGWPGFGGVPADPDINGIADLVTMVVQAIDQPCAIIAQSMGGVVAVQAALQRSDLVTHLVLAATSGGVDMSDLQVENWRPAFIQANPHLPRWFSDYNADLSDQLCTLQIPTLLLWGDADQISPVAVGLRLESLLPRSKLHVIGAGEHDFANKYAREVAPFIDAYLQTE